MFISFYKWAKLANCVDDKTIHINSAEMETLLDILEKESERIIKWFEQNEMIVNPDRF